MGCVCVCAQIYVFMYYVCGCVCLGEVIGVLPEGGGGRCGGAGRAGGALGRGGGGRLGSRDEGPPIAESTGEPGKGRRELKVLLHTACCDRGNHRA